MDYLEKWLVSEYCGLKSLNFPYLDFFTIFEPNGRFFRFWWSFFRFFRI